MHHQSPEEECSSVQAVTGFSPKHLLAIAEDSQRVDGNQERLGDLHVQDSIWVPFWILEHIDGQKAEKASNQGNYHQEAELSEPRAVKL